MKTFLDWKIILILILLVAVVIQTCSSNEPSLADQPFKDRIDVLENQVKQRNTKIDSLTNENQAILIAVKKDSAKDVHEKRVFTGTITRLNRRLADSKEQVMQQVDSLPIVKAYIEDLDSAYVVTTDRLQTVEYLYAKTQLSLAGITGNFDEQLRQSQLNHEDAIKVGEEYRKAWMKERKKGKFWKGAAIVGTTLGIIGGSLM